MRGQIVPALTDYPAPPAQAVDHGELLCRLEAMQAEVDALREQTEAGDRAARAVDRELRLASRLQRDFLPKRLPEVGRVRFGRLYHPAGHVSGDTYDVRRLDEHNVGLYLADAVGHGLPAALLAMFLHNALRTKRIGRGGRYGLVPPGEAVRELNESLAGQDLDDATFATAVYARVDAESGRVDFASAGHPAPLLLRGTGEATEVSEVAGDGALLGVLADEEYADVTVDLSPGDRMIFYTDGVETAFVRPGEVPDFAAWRSAVESRRHLPADALLSELWEIIGRSQPTDDVTIVTLELR